MRTTHVPEPILPPPSSTQGLTTHGVVSQPRPLGYSRLVPTGTGSRWRQCRLGPKPTLVSAESDQESSSKLGNLFCISCAH
jgi:hypothetical protein